MSTRIRVYTRPDWFEIATVRKTDIKFGGRSLTPSAIYPLQNSGGSAAGAVGGAVAGAILAGGVGALVGAVAGGRGRMGFAIETHEGPKLVCSCTASEYTGIYMLVDKMISLPRPIQGTVPTPKPHPNFNWVMAVIGGPFYLLRYGPTAFLIGLIATVVTVGWVWPLMWLFSLFLERRDPRQTHFG